MSTDVYPFRTDRFISRRALLLGAAATAALSGRPKAFAAGLPTGPALRRGGSIHTALNWPELAPGSRETYQWPPFAAAKYKLDMRLLDSLRRAGMDFIRLTVDPGPFLALQGEQRKELDNILLSRCRQVIEANLSVIVDFHPISQVAAHAPVRIIDTPSVFKAYAEMVGRTAQVMRALDPSRAALELMNEPPYGYDPATIARWQHMLVEMHAAARKANPDLALIMTGPAGGGIRGLLSVDAKAFADQNLYWSFHYYDPHPFTHQGVLTDQDNMRHFRYLSDLPYPVDGSSAAVEQSVRQAIMADKSLTSVQRTQQEGAATQVIREYFAAEYGPARIAADFAKVLDWANGHGVTANRIFLGEFGAAKRSPRGNGALNSHRYAWLRDVRKEAEKRGFAWALWDIDDDQMGIVTHRGSGLLELAIVRALGLKD